MENNPSVAESLAAVSSSRSEIADRLVTPWWYHPALGALLGVQALIVGASLGTAGLALMLFPILGMLGLATVYSHMTGIDLSSLGGRGRQARGLQWVLFGFGTAGLLVSVVLGNFMAIGWVPWAVAGFELVMATVVGRAYDRALRAELRGSVA